MVAVVVAMAIRAGCLGSGPRKKGKTGHLQPRSRFRFGADFEGDAQFIRPGTLFEMDIEEVNGRKYKVWKHVRTVLLEWQLWVVASGALGSRAAH